MTKLTIGYSSQIVGGVFFVNIKTLEILSRVFGGKVIEYKKLWSILKNKMPIGMGIPFFEMPPVI